jgi:hypothetical protein
MRKGERRESEFYSKWANSAQTNPPAHSNFRKENEMAHALSHSEKSRANPKIEARFLFAKTQARQTMIFCSDRFRNKVTRP